MIPFGNLIKVMAQINVYLHKDLHVIISQVSRVSLNLGHVLLSFSGKGISCRILPWGLSLKPPAE